MSSVTNKYKVVIIDDERLARAEIKRHLFEYPEFDVIGEASHADEGIRVIEAEKPHLIYLDIQMPKKSGFDLLEDLTMVPKVVFTTAYAEYAAKAFDINALDYLVKPIRKERFSISIDKVRREFSQQNGPPLEFLVHHKIFIKDGEKCHFIPLSDVRYIESMENYARFHFNRNNAMIKKSLNNIEEKLDQRVFFRINRSYIVNTNYISEIHPSFNNRLKLVLETGETFEVSSRQSVRFKNWNSL